MSEEWLPELRKDIPYFHELGINSIFICHSDTTKAPDAALKVLQDAGIYVLLEIFTNVMKRVPFSVDLSDTEEELDMARLYSQSIVRRNLFLVDQTAKFPNVLGYSVSMTGLNGRGETRLAAIYRAAVRDVKHYLHLRGGRTIPVGMNFSVIQGPSRQAAPRFMAAGAPEERVDFCSFGVYDWVGPSSFQISGYSSMVESLGQLPVPMFFNQYGAAVGRSRVLDEVECLLSPDMTGVFSGGFFQTYAYTDPKRDRKTSVDEDGDDEEDFEVPGGYDLVNVAEDGTRVPKADFQRYKERLASVSSKTSEQVIGQHARKHYEDWRGVFNNAPGVGANGWLAQLGDVPPFPLEWSQVL